MTKTDALTTTNHALREAHARDLEHTFEVAHRRQVDAERVVAQLARFAVAVPSWALGTGGTRFGRYPGGGEPRDVFEKLDDIAVIHRLTGGGAAPGTGEERQ